MSKKRPSKQSLDNILADVDFEADDNDSTYDTALCQFMDGGSVFLTDMINTAKVDNINGPAIQHIRIYSAQDAADGPLNIEADFPSNTENFAEFIDRANDNSADPEGHTILPNTNNEGEEPHPNTNVAAMGTGMMGLLQMRIRLSLSRHQHYPRQLTINFMKVL